MTARDPQTSPAGARRRARYAYAVLSRAERGEEPAGPEWLPGHGDVEASTVPPDPRWTDDEAIQW